MIKRLEQVTALVVAAGLALVSYWLFFSWAGGERGRSPEKIRSSQPAAGLDQPLLAITVVEGRDVTAHLLNRHRQVERLAQLHDSLQGAAGILERLPEQ